MRTTITLDDEVAADLKQRAHERGLPFKQVVNDTLRAGLRADAPEPRTYRLEPARLGGVRPGFDLDKALRIADGLEDAEIARELHTRK